MGFHDVLEVAEGAMVTTEKEGHELLEKIAEGQAFMTTSCCPSYIELVNKHVPEMEKYVSSTRSPMYYTARIAKKKYPDAKVVFVGPCIAKRKEAQRDDEVDYVMTFDEIGSFAICTRRCCPCESTCDMEPCFGISSLGLKFAGEGIFFGSASASFMNPE